MNDSDRELRDRWLDVFYSLDPYGKAPDPRLRNSNLGAHSRALAALGIVRMAEDRERSTTPIDPDDLDALDRDEERQA